MVSSIHRSVRVLDKDKSRTITNDEFVDWGQKWDHHRIEFTDGEFTTKFRHEAVQSLGQRRKKTIIRDDFIDGEFHRETKIPMRRLIL